MAQLVEPDLGNASVGRQSSITTPRNLSRIRIEEVPVEHSAAPKIVTIQEMAEMGIAVALGVALSYLSKAIWSMPMGGTLELGIIPVLYIALKWGWRDGLIAGLALGFVTMATDWYFVHPVQIILDYPLPGLVLGLAGLPVFRRGHNWWIGILTAGTLRYICHVVSGVVFFASYANCLLYTSPSPRDRTRSRMP